MPYCSLSCQKTFFWAKHHEHLSESIAAKLSRVGECLEWQGQRSPRQYGKIQVRGKHWRVHRLVWTLAKGPIPDGLMICHRCDNPPCCNLDHLFLGTLQENTDDMITKGRNATGDRSGARLHPETRPRGDANGSRKYPERLKRGDDHYSRLHPERLARGDRSGLRLHPESVRHGQTNGASKLTDDQVREIYRRYHFDGLTQTALGREYGVSQVMVGLIVNGKKWQTVTGHHSKSD